MNRRERRKAEKLMRNKVFVKLLRKEMDLPSDKEMEKYIYNKKENNNKDV